MLSKSAVPIQAAPDSGRALPIAGRYDLGVLDLLALCRRAVSQRLLCDRCSYGISVDEAVIANA